MNCAQCGQKLSIHVKFCGSCGASTSAKIDETIGDLTDNIEHEKCHSCSTDMALDDLFCGHCGVSRSDVDIVGECSSCGMHFHYSDLFCDVDGSALEVRRAHDTQHHRQIGYRRRVSDHAPQARPDMQMFLDFWERHKILAIITISIAASAGILLTLGAEQVGDLPIAIATTLAFATVISWPVALWRSDKVLGTVDKMDDWFDRAADWSRYSEGKFRRIVLFPVLWGADRIRRLSLRSPDPFAAAAVRFFCYVTTVMIIATLIFFALVMIAVLVVMAIALMIIGFVLNDDIESPRSLNFAQRAVKGRGKKIYSGKGWLSDERVGRVDEDGRIYEGKNWLSEKRVGRIDDEGKVHSGSNWLNERRVGRVDEEGKTFSGTNWLNERREGRVDEKGNVHRGKNWLSEKRVGRLDDD